MDKPARCQTSCTLAPDIIASNFAYIYMSLFDNVGLSLKIRVSLKF
jgi:hypothetical protein